MRHQASYFAFLGLSFICKNTNTILSRLCKITVSEYSINAGFYNVMEPRHYFPSIKTLPQTYWSISTVHSPGLAFALSIEFWPQDFCIWLAYSLNHANVTIFLRPLDFKWIACLLFIWYTSTVSNYYYPVSAFSSSKQFYLLWEISLFHFCDNFMSGYVFIVIKLVWTLATKLNCFLLYW